MRWRDEDDRERGGEPGGRGELIRAIAQDQAELDAAVTDLLEHIRHVRHDLRVGPRAAREAWRWLAGALALGFIIGWTRQ